MEEHPYFEDAKRNYNLVNNLYKSRKIRHTSTKYKFFAISTKRQSEQYLFEAENPKRKYWIRTIHRIKLLLQLCH